MMRVAAISVLLCVLAAATPGAPPATDEAPATQPIETAVARGVEFLEKSQAAEGFWGTGTVTHGNEVAGVVPGTMISFRLGATALCVMALREAGEHAAHDRAVAYLLTAPDARRDDGAFLYNTWAHIYITQALTQEMKQNSDPRIADVVRRNINALEDYATFEGGWNYYDFEAQTQHDSMGPTSFGTAAGLVALWEARAAGLTIPQKLVDQSVRRLEEMRLSNSAFLYGSDYKYVPRLPANLGRGAVGRTQPSNFAIRLWDPQHASLDQIRLGLDAFFESHAFLEMGRKHPIPHSKWYQTSGYYFYFDHYYAARLLAMLPQADRETYAKKLASIILGHQEPDGSWWDYIMWDYHKPYGTAFAVMTLLRCR